MANRPATSLFEELQRRKVFRTGAAYLVAAWLIAQIADLLFGAFLAPEWALQSLIVVLAIGFPVTLVLAWVYEITSEGVRRTSDSTAESQPITGGYDRRVDYAIIGVLLVAVGWFAAEKMGVFEFGAPGAADRRSIAVLPFTNRSGNPDDAYFVDGIHDDLLSSLARIHDLVVISRTSVIQYRNPTKSIPEIGQELGVSVVLEGGVQRAGDQVRINVQLIDSRTDEHLWADTFDRVLNTENIFAIQSEITKTIADELAAILTPDETQAIDKLPTENLEAYNALLLGDQRRSLVTVDGRAQAEAYYRRALELDANYALAWQRLADVLVLRWRNHTLPDEALLEAHVAINRAFDLDQAEGRIWLTKGEIELELTLRGEGTMSFSEIDALYRRALDLLPNYGAAWSRYAVLLSTDPTKRDQVIELMRRAIRVDPLSAQSHNMLGDTLRKAHEFEEAQRMFARARELQPDNPLGYWHAGETYRDAGELADAMIWMEKAYEFEKNDADGPFTLAIVATELGIPELADFWIAKGMEIGSEHFMAIYTRAVPLVVRDDVVGLQALAEAEIARGIPELRVMPIYRRVLRDRDIDNGRPELALERYEAQVPELFIEEVPIGDVHPNDVADLAYLLQHMGQDERARTLLAQLLRYLETGWNNGGVNSRMRLRFAEALGLLGRTEEATKYLEAVARNDWPNGWQSIKSNRILDPLRDLPAFREMVERIESQRAEQRERYAELRRDKI
jgi:TolB-like protein